MRVTHWNPRFSQLALHLTGRLLQASASYTRFPADRWPEAQLSLMGGHSCALQSSTGLQNDGLLAFQFIKSLLVCSVAVDEALPSPSNSTWPLLQQHFSKLRTLIILQPGNGGRVLPVSGFHFASKTNDHCQRSCINALLSCCPLTNCGLPLTMSETLNPLIFPGFPDSVGFNVFQSSPMQNNVHFPVLFSPSTTQPLTPLTATSPSFSLQSPQLAIRNPSHFLSQKIILNEVMRFWNSSLVIPPITMPQISIAPRIVSPLILLPHQQSQRILFSSKPTVDLHNKRVRDLNSFLLTSQLLKQSLQKLNYAYVHIVIFKDEAKTRFMCTKCNKQWTSMKGAITFVVALSHQSNPIQILNWNLHSGSNVLMELFPQACSDCSERGDHVLCPPKWYPEEIDKVLRNLFVNIHRVFYKSVIAWDQQFDRRRRPGHPTGRHDNTKCLACLNGMCVSAVAHQSQYKHAPPATTEDESENCHSEQSPACKRRLLPQSSERPSL